MEYYFVMAVRGLISRVGTGGGSCPQPPNNEEVGGTDTATTITINNCQQYNCQLSQWCDKV